MGTKITQLNTRNHYGLAYIVETENSIIFAGSIHNPNRDGKHGDKATSHDITDWHVQQFKK